MSPLNCLDKKIDRLVAVANALQSECCHADKRGISKIIEFEISRLPFVNLKSENIRLEMTRL